MGGLWISHNGLIHTIFLSNLPSHWDRRIVHLATIHPVFLSCIHDKILCREQQHKENSSTLAPFWKGCTVLCTCSVMRSQMVLLTISPNILSLETLTLKFIYTHSFSLLSLAQTPERHMIQQHKQQIQQV